MEWEKMKRDSTMRRLCCRETIGGTINIVLENQSISIGFAPVMNGTNTIKFITIMTILHQRSFRDTNLIATEKASSPDYVILRFHAGPPYEDIAFTIVNREWEYSQKKGFKCNFEKGILHLWFNFRRYRYRR